MSIKLNTLCQYFLNPKMEIPTTHEILLFRIMLCAIVLIFGATYVITLFIDSLFVCQTYAVILLELWLFETVNIIYQEIVQLVVGLFAAELTLFVVVCLSFFWRSCLESPLCSTIVMNVKHVFKRNLTCITELFKKILFFFIMYPQSFLSRRASALVHPHWRALILFTTENVCLATTFTRWEVSTSKYGSRISSSSFPLDHFRTWPRAPLDECLSTARIFLSLFLTTTSMIKSDYIMHPLPSS